MASYGWSGWGGLGKKGLKGTGAGLKENFGFKNKKALIESRA